ncbi:Pro-kumamolisin, activation domain-containing protein [Mycena sp. CBHHK59/15]|nr:Pro-kumamolisin, activation domain-containing protein [Mycena sp. CBHHK59/15]
MVEAIVILSLFLGAVCGNFVVLERRDNPPDGFSRIGPTPLDQTLTLRLALNQRDIPGLEDTIYEVSTPGSSRYGQYLTKEEVEQFAAPSEDTISQVNEWLSSKNLTSSPISPAGDWIAINLSVSQANELLVADFSTFQNQDTNVTVVRTLSYSIPTTLKSSISFVYPTVTFDHFFRSFTLSLNRPTVSPRETVPADCQAEWTPACLQKLYGIPSSPAKPAANVLGVSEFFNLFADKTDLKIFLETFRPDMPSNTSFDLISVDGGINNQLPAGSSIFAALDIQYTVGLATGVPVAFISTGTLANDVTTEFLDQANYLLSLPKPPQTIVNNDGNFESDLDGSLPIAISLCNAYAQLAARGVSYIVSTGIFGAGGIPFGNCLPFDPPFPATCPFVTAVGGTEFSPDNVAETGASLSGGGFSNIFKRPGYQNEAVTSYLNASGSTKTSPFNISGRATPDLSAISRASIVVEAFIDQGVGTTALSANIVASMVSLLTNERIAAGKPGLGFLNPLIYQNPSAFKDMTGGSTLACDDPGFNATSGWDPVTGFGSPVYENLREICNKL